MPNILKGIPLHERSSAGLCVRIFHEPGGDTVTLAVAENHRPAVLTVVPKENALDAFNHPFPYQYWGEKTRG